MTTDYLTAQDWLVEIVTPGETIQRRTSQIASLPAGTAFSLSGTVDTAGYLYVLQLGSDEVAVLYPAGGGADREDEGTVLRLPSDEPRFVAPLTGPIRVVVAPSVVAADEWVDLIDGREDKAKKT